MNYNDWLKAADEAVGREIVDSYRAARHGGWSENYITTRILGAIEDIGTELRWENLKQQVVWEGHKLTGNNESTFGDIAVFVRVWLLSDRYIDGVAFYEAKRQYFDEKGKVEGFKSLKAEQLSRIAKATHASHVLFYDVDQDKQHAYAGSVPTAFMKELVDASYAAVGGRTVLRYGDPWLYFLGNNLKGFGLDFSESGVRTVKDLVASSGAALAIMNVSIGKMDLEPKLDPFFSRLPNYEKAWGVARELDEEVEQDVTREGPEM